LLGRLPSDSWVKANAVVADGQVEFISLARVYGVKAVANDLEVKLFWQRTDPEIARSAVQALESHVSIPSENIKVSVKNGRVTLEGTVVLAATQIARAVLRHKSKVTVFVPHYAMSGGTLIALAADEIVMCEHAVLGPVDPQLVEHPAASIVKVVRQKPIAEVDDETLILADQAEKALSQMECEVGELLAAKYPADKAAELAKLLASGTWTHDYPITYERANALGLRVQKEMPESILHLMQLYPQPPRKQPAVEYLPFPYRSGRSDSLISYFRHLPGIFCASESKSAEPRRV
jgi:ClpP class serine protease